MAVARLKIHLVVVGLATAAFVSSCSSETSTSDAASSSADRARTVAMQPTPRRLLSMCRGVARLRAVCPSRVPRTEYGYQRLTRVHVCERGRGDCLVRRVDLFEMQYGGENRRRPEANRPPAFAHLVLYAGDLGGRTGYQKHGDSAFLFDWPDPRESVRSRDGLLRRSGSEALWLGKETWSGITGELVLAPPWPSGGLFGNHLIFRFGTEARGRVVSLHAWEPFSEAVATLKAVVASTPVAG